MRSIALAGACSALLPGAVATAQAAPTPGAVSAPHPTLHNVSIEWSVADEDSVLGLEPATSYGVELALAATDSAAAIEIVTVASGSLLDRAHHARAGAVERRQYPARAATVSAVGA